MLGRRGTPHCRARGAKRLVAVLALTGLGGLLALGPAAGQMLRQGVLGTARVKLASNWVAFGGARYDLNAQKLSGTNVGLGCIDDCLTLALNDITEYSYSSAAMAAPYTVVSKQQIMLQRSLRTLGNTTTTQTIGTSGTTGTSNGPF